MHQLDKGTNTAKRLSEFVVLDKTTFHHKPQCVPAGGADQSKDPSICNPAHLYHLVNWHFICQYLVVLSLWNDNCEIMKIDVQLSMIDDRANRLV